MPAQIKSLPDQNGVHTMEETARQLEASGDFRILRRLVPRPLTPVQSSSEKIGLIIDLETTGLDHTRDEVIELGMVKFTYSESDTITGVSAVFQAFRQPSTPIPAEVTELTGITDATVAGQMIEATDVDAFIADADIVIAHNAAFDRRFAERFWPAFEHKSWACSAKEVDWKSLGFGSAKLSHLLAECGLFHDAHRAVDDCHALLEVLARPLRQFSGNAMTALLCRARETTFRIWAQGAPYELKDALKRRGYRWNDGTDGQPRSWHIDVAEAYKERELEYLRKEIYQRDLDILVRKLTARQRYSNRYK